MNKYIHKIIALFSSSQHSEELTTEVQKWLIDDRFADEKDKALRQLWDETDSKADSSTWRSLHAVYERLGIDSRTRGGKGIRITWWRTVAAIIAVAVVSVAATLYLSQGKERQVPMLEAYTSAGNMKTITLPDGSIVRTNSGTLLLYPEKFVGDKRTVYLIGEADFKVAKDPKKPFTVKASQIAVTALGTEFNVSAYPEDEVITSTLVHGAVRVDCANNDTYTLLPGQQVNYWRRTGRSQIADININDATAWQRGATVFRGKNLAEIFNVLERRYDVSFRYNASRMNDDKYNFKFRADSDLDEVMKVIKDVAQRLDYRIEDGVCYVRFR